MTIQPAPALEPRGYQELLDEALARIAVHNPEYTNFNGADPGVTMLELWAFLTEALAYRANQIPERNRRKFIDLLGVPAQPALAARGIVEITRERGELETVTVDAGLEVRAGAVSFRTDDGLDVLPVLGECYVKQPVTDASPDEVDYYRQLYASLRGTVPDVKDVQLYRTVALADLVAAGGALLQTTADNSLWVALLLPESPPPTEADRQAAARALAGRTLNLGVVPVISSEDAQADVGSLHAPVVAPLEYQVPMLTSDHRLPEDANGRVATYRSLAARAGVNVLVEPGTVQVSLPESAAEIGVWTNLEPLEEGAADFPPSLADTKLQDRLVTWLRLRAASGAQAELLYAGINAVTVTQCERVVLEPLPLGTGQPDQSARLAKAPVLPATVQIVVTPASGGPQTWREIDDLLAAGPEVAVRDPRLPPGTPASPSADPRVFVVDPATGLVRFGDGARGARPPAQARVQATYDVTLGGAGNLGVGAISTAPELSGTFRVGNPVPTWGGADTESLAQAEKYAARFLQHRDRLVTSSDFEAIVRRTPGVQLGRVEVLPSFNPQTTPPTQVPGAVTVMVVPRSDALHPSAPEPDRLFLTTICRDLDPRRLVTTEVFLRGPSYVDVWISIGLEVEVGRDIAVVHEAVRDAVRRFLSPLDPAGEEGFLGILVPLGADPGPREPHGWPLGKALQRLEVAAVANRVAGVRLVRDVQIGSASGLAVEQLAISGLELPRVRVIGIGAEADLDALRGQHAPPSPSDLVPVPVVPDTC
jgi:hypothetical protein